MGSLNRSFGLSCSLVVKLSLFVRVGVGFRGILATEVVGGVEMGVCVSETTCFTVSSSSSTSAGSRALPLTSDSCTLRVPTS